MLYLYLCDIPYHGQNDCCFGRGVQKIEEGKNAWRELLINDQEMLKTKLEDAERDLMPFMILPLTRDVAMESARIQAALTKRGRTIGINDIHIAATAIVNKETIVTRNATNFNYIEGLLLEKY